MHSVPLLRVALATLRLQTFGYKPSVTNLRLETFDYKPSVTNLRFARSTPTALQNRRFCVRALRSEAAHRLNKSRAFAANLRRNSA